MLVACVNTLCARGDRVPAESTWTHVVNAFKKTLLRKAVKGIGIESFDIKADVGSKDPIHAEEGSDAYNSMLNKSRISKTLEYYADARGMHELAIYTFVLYVYDKFLLYYMLGSTGFSKTKQSFKVDLLLG